VNDRGEWIYIFFFLLNLVIDLCIFWMFNLESVTSVTTKTEPKRTETELLGSHFLKEPIG